MDRWFDVGAFTYAHRGLWDAIRPENSIAAFEAASAAGLGSELDVRITADGQLVVFHDSTMERICGRPERVDALTFQELRQARLPDGSAIPTLNEALEAMAGKPTLVEVKIDSPASGQDRIRRAAQAALDALRETRAPAAIMSFDEPAASQFAKGAEGRPTGCLIEPLAHLGDTGVRDKVARALDAGCTYLAPHVSALATVRQAAPHMPLVAWTVRNIDELSLARQHDAAPIFEGFSSSLAKRARATI